MHTAAAYSVLMSRETIRGLFFRQCQANRFNPLISIRTARDGQELNTLALMYCYIPSIFCLLHAQPPCSKHRQNLQLLHKVQPTVLFWRNGMLVFVFEKCKFSARVWRPAGCPATPADSPFCRPNTVAPQISNSCSGKSHTMFNIDNLRGKLFEYHLYISRKTSKRPQCKAL